MCAGPCQEVDNDLVCSYVDWVWNKVNYPPHIFCSLRLFCSKGENVGELELSLGECGPHSKSTWTTVGIVIGCIVAALLLIGLVAFIVSRRKYSQAATNDY